MKIELLEAIQGEKQGEISQKEIISKEATYHFRALEHILTHRLIENTHQKMALDLLIATFHQTSAAIKLS